MKKDYKKPFLILKEIKIENEIAVLGISDGQNAADWNNIDFDSWDSLFNPKP